MRTFARLVLLVTALLGLPGCGVGPTVAAILLGSQDSGSSSQPTTVIVADDADLLVSRGPQDPGDTTEGRDVDLTATQFRITPTADTLLESITLEASGSGDDRSLSAIRLYHDQNSDGVLDDGEPQLGPTRVFLQDDGQVVFDGMERMLPGGVAFDVLVVYRSPNSAGEDDAFQVTIIEEGIEASTELSNGDVLPVPLFGLPVAGATKTISSRGTLSAAIGPRTPVAPRSFANAQNTTLFQLELRASTSEGIRVDALNFQATGSGDDFLDVSSYDLFLDADNDGLLNPANDVPVALGATASANNGQVQFSSLAQSLLPGEIVRYLVGLNLAGLADDDETFGLVLPEGGVVATGLMTGETLTTRNLPLAPAPLTIARAALTVRNGVGNLARQVVPGTTIVPALHLDLQVGDAEPVVISSLGVNVTGSGDDVADLAGVRLVVDTNNNGLFDMGEPLLAGPADFDADDGQVLLDGFARTIPASALERWLVVLDVANAARGGDTFTCGLTGEVDVVVAGQTSELEAGADVPLLTGLPIQVRGALTLDPAPFNPPPQTALANASDVAMLQVRLGAGVAETVRITSLTVATSGTGNEGPGVTQVQLILDADSSGDFSAGDSVLRTLVLANDDAPLVVDDPAGIIPGGIPAAGFRDLLLTYSLSGQPTQGQTFRMSLPRLNLEAVGVDSGLPIPIGGVDVNGNALTAQRARLSVGPGNANPGNATALNGEVGVEALQLRLGAGAGEPVAVNALTVRAGGNLDDPTAVTQVRVYAEGAGTLGVLDGSDVLLGTGSFVVDDGTVTFSGAPLLTIPRSTQTNVLFVYDVSPASAVGTLDLSFAGISQVSATGTLSGLSAELAGSPAQGGTQFVVRAELDVDQGGQPPSTRDTFPAGLGLPVLQLELNAGPAEGVRVTEITLGSAGSTPEQIAVAQVELIVDLDGDGLRGMGEPSLGTATYTMDDEDLVFDVTGSFDIPAGGTRSVLALVDLDAAAPSNQTVRLRLAGASSVVAQGLISGTPITPSGNTVEGNPLQVILGSLSAAQGPAPTPDREVLAGATRLPVLQVRLSAGAIESVGVGSIAFTHSGAGDPFTDLTAVDLVLDVNRDGAPLGEPILASSTFAGGVATFNLNPGDLDVPALGSVDVLLVYDVASAAPLGASFQAQLDLAADITATGNASNLPIAPTGPAVAGGAVSVAQASLTLQALPGLDPAVLPAAASVPGARFVLDAGAAEPVQIDSLRLTAAGTLDPAADVAGIRVLRESDPADGDPSNDTEVAAFVGGFTAGEVTIPIAPGALVIPAGSNRTVLIVLDLQAPTGSDGQTLTVSLPANADVTARGATSGLTVTPAGLVGPASSATTVIEGALEVRLGPDSPVARPLSVTQIDVVGAQVVVEAGPAEPIRVQTLQVAVQGSLDPDVDVASVRLFLDQNANGALDSDALLGTETLSGGSATFTIAPGALDVPASSERALLVVLDLAGTASAGDTVQVRVLDPTAEVTAQGLITGLGVIPSGGAVNAATSTITARTLELLAGTPLGPRTVFANEADVPVLQAVLRAGAVEAVRVETIQVAGGAAGTGDDTGIRVRLFRDRNGDARLDAGDTPIGDETFAADEDTVTFTVTGLLDLSASSEERLLVVYDLPNTGVNGDTATPELVGASAVGLGSNNPAAILGSLPVGGRVLTVEASSLTVSQPAPLGPRSAFPNAQDQVVLRARITAGAVEGARITAIDLRPSMGAQGDQTAATAAVFVDQNGNQTLELNQDALVVSGVAVANGTFTAGGFNLDLDANASVDLLIVYDLDGTPLGGDAFGVELDATGITGQGLRSGGGITDLVGLAASGADLVIEQAQLTLASGPAAPNPTDLLRNATNATLLQAQLTTGPAEGVRIASVQFTPGGAIDDENGYASLRLVRDLNSDGLADLGEPVLNMATGFPADDAPLTFSVPVGALDIAASSSASILLVADLSAQLGDTVAPSLQLAGINAQGRASGLPAAAMGSDVAPSPRAVVGTGLTATADTFNPAPGFALSNPVRLPVLQLRLTAGAAEAVRVTSVRLTPTGTLSDDLEVDALELFLDANGNGRADPGDPLLAAAPNFPADDTPRTFAIPAGDLDIPAGGGVSLLVTVDLDASDGDRLTVAVADASVDLVAQGLTSGLAVVPSGSVAGGQRVIQTGALTSSVGAQNPAPVQVFPGATQLPAAQLTLTAGPAEPVDVLSLALRPTGDVLDDTEISGVRLLLDADGDGAPSPGDVTLGSVGGFPADDTAQVFAFTPGQLRVPAGGSLDVLAVLDLQPTVVVGRFVQAVFDAPAASVVAEGAQSGLPITGSGPAVAGGAITVIDGDLTLSLGPANPPARDVSPAASGVVLLQTQLSAGANEGIRVEAIEVTPAGSLDDTTGYSDARLLLDADMDGTPSTGDVVLASGVTFASDDAPSALSIPAGALDLGAGSSAQVLFVVDFGGSAAATQSAIAAVSSASGRGLTSGRFVAPMGLPVVGNAVQLVPPSVTASRGANDPGNQSVFVGARQVPVLQLFFTAGADQAVDVLSLTVAAAGSGDDAADVLALRLLQDLDADGVPSTGDVLLGTTTYAADDGSATFTLAGNALELPAGGSAHVLVVYDFDQPANGAEFTCSLSALSAVGAVDGATASVAGLSILSGVVTAEVGAATITAGAFNPPARPIFPDDEEVSVLQAVLTASAVESVEVGSLTFTPAGSADDQTDITSLTFVLDLDGDGLFGAEPVLANRPGFPGDDAPLTLTLPSGALTIAPMTTATILVLANFDAAPTRDFAVSLTGATARGVGSGQAITPTGTAAGETVTVTVGSLDVQAGANNPAPRTLLAGGSNVPLAQLALVAGAREDVLVDRVRLTPTGTADDGGAYLQLRVVLDSNGNGVDDAEPVLTSGTFNADGLPGSFAFSPLRVPANQTRNLLIVGDLSPDLPAGVTLAVGVAASSDVAAVGSDSVQTLSPTGGAVAGGLITVSRPSLTGGAGTNQPASRNVFRNATGVESLQLQLSAGPADGVEVQRVDLRLRGTLDDGLSVDQVLLYRDDNDNGVLDGDTVLDVFNFPVDDGTLTFNLSPGDLIVPAGDTVNLLAVVDLNGSGRDGETLETFLTDATAGIAAVGSDSGLTVSPAGGAVPGATLTVEEGLLDVGLGGNDPGVLQVLPGAMDVATLQLQLSASMVEGIQVDGVTLTPRGTADDGVDRINLRLVHDVDGDGAFDMGEPVLATLGSWSGDEAPTLFSLSPPLQVPATLTEHLLLVETLAGAVFDTATFASGIADGMGVAAVGTLSGASPRVRGAPVRGALSAVRYPELRLVNGPNQVPLSDVFPGTAEVPLVQLRLEASSAEPVEVSQVRLRARGTGNDQFGYDQLRLFRDVNSDGALDVGDVQLSSPQIDFGFDDGEVQFFFGPGELVVPAGGSVDLLLVGDFSTQPFEGDRFESFAQDAVDALMAVGQTSGQAPNLLGGEVSGGSLRIVRGRLDVEDAGGIVSNNVEVFDTETDVPALHLRLSASAVQDVDVTQLSFNEFGSNAMNGLADVEAYHDVNGNGVVDFPDVLLGQLGGGPSMSPASIAFASSLTITAGSSETLLLVYDLATAADVGDFFQAQLDPMFHVLAIGVASGQPVPVSGGSLTGPNLNVTQGTLDVNLGPNSPFSPQARPLQTEVVVAQFELEAGPAEPITVDQVTLDAFGDGDDLVDLLSVTLYHDQNQNGLLDGDPLLDVSTFDANNGAALLNAGVTVPRSGKRALLVVYDVAASAADMSTFGVAITSSLSLAVSTPSGSVPQVNASSVMSSTLQIEAPGVSAMDSGAVLPSDEPLAGQLLYPMVSLEVFNGNAEARITQFTLTPSGTGDDLDLTQVQLVLDLGKDGVLSGDPVLAMGGFSGDDTATVFPINPGDLDLAPGQSVTVAVAYDFGVAGIDSSFAVEISDFVANDRGTGGALPVSITPPSSPTRTLQAAPSVSVTDLGTPALPLPINGQREVMLRVRLDETTGNGDVDLTRLEVSASGLGDDVGALSRVEVWVDLNQDGLASPGDDDRVGLAQFDVDDGMAVFAGLNVFIPALDGVELLVTYDLSGAGASGDDFQAQLDTLDLRSSPVGVPLTSMGLPVPGPLRAIGDVAALELQAGPMLSNLVADPGDTLLPVLSLRIVELSGTASGRLTGLLLMEGGTGAPEVDLAAVRLVHDVNADGLFDPGDRTLAISSYLATGGPAAFAVDEVIAPSGVLSLLVLYDLEASAPVGVDFLPAVSQSDVIVEDGVSGQPLVPSGLDPVFGITLTVDGPDAGTVLGDGTSGTVTAGPIDGNTRLTNPRAVAVDLEGRVLICDTNKGDVLRVDLEANTIERLAGQSTTGIGAGDGGLATAASLSNVEGICVDLLGRVLIADTSNNAIRRIELDGTIDTIVGILNAPASSTPDGNPALGANIANPRGLDVEPDGALVFAETASRVIRRVRTDGTLQTLVGQLNVIGSGTDGELGTEFLLNNPVDVAVAPDGAIYLTDAGRVMRWDPVTSRVRVVYGGGGGGISPSGVASAQNSSGDIWGVDVDAVTGEVYAVDHAHHRVVKIDAVADTFETVLGQAQSQGLQDGAPGTSLARNPRGVAVDPRGSVVVVEEGNHTLRLVEGVQPLQVLVEDLPFAPQGRPYAAAVRAYGGRGLYGWALTSGGLPAGLMVEPMGTPGSRVVGTPTLAETQTFTLEVSDGVGATAQGMFTVHASAPTIDTVAGISGSVGNDGDGLPGPVSRLRGPARGEFAPDGAFVFVDIDNSVIRRLDPQTGILNTVVGNGETGTVAGPVPAREAPLDLPRDVCVDAVGTIYFVESTSHTVRKVDARTGLLTTFVGTFGSAGAGTSGQDRSTFALNTPEGITIDPAGDLWVCDSTNHRIVRVDMLSGRCFVVAGDGSLGSGGDGGPAIDAQFNFPRDLCVSSDGVFVAVADTFNARVRVINRTNGLIDTFAGTGTPGIAGDGGPANMAEIGLPDSVDLDPAGNLYIAEANRVIRRVEVSDQTISIYAGNQGTGSSGDGGDALAAAIDTPSCVAVDPAGVLYSVSFVRNDVRQVRGLHVASAPLPTATVDLRYEATVRAVGGGPTYNWSVVEGALPSGLSLAQDLGEVARIVGTPDQQETQEVVLQVSTNGMTARARFTVEVVGPTITTVAGNGTFGFSGDGGPALRAQFNSPRRVAFDRDGNAYVTDLQNQRLRKIDTNGIITTIIGNGVSSRTGSGGPASAATVADPVEVVVNDLGDVIFTEFNAGGGLRRIDGRTQIVEDLRVTASGLIGLALREDNGLEFSQPTAHRVFRTDLFLSTSSLIAGDGGSAFTGDLQVATQASLGSPNLIGRVRGDLWIYSADQNRLFRREDDGSLVLLGGDGSPVLSGDGGPLALAQLSDDSRSLVWDGRDRVYFADTLNHAVRVIHLPTRTIDRLAGAGVAATSGDGGPLQQAEINGPFGVELDPRGRLWVVEESAHSLRRIDGLYSLEIVADELAPTPWFAPTNRAFRRELRAFGGRGVIEWSVDQLPAGLQLRGLGDRAEVVGTPSNPAALTVTFTARDAFGGVASVQVPITVLDPTIQTLTGGGATQPGFVSLAEASFSQGAGQMAVDSQNRVYFSDVTHHNVYRVDPATNLVERFAGTGAQGNGVAGQHALDVALNSPFGLAVDAADNVYFVDQGNQRVLRVSAQDHVVTEVVSGATAISNCVAVDARGDLYYADTNQVFRVDVHTGATEAVAGDGMANAFVAGPALATSVTDLFSLEFAPDGRLYMSSRTPSEVYALDLGTGMISLFRDCGGDPVHGMTVDAAGGVYVCFDQQHRVDYITPDGTNQVTVVGTGTGGGGGDGMLGTAAQLNVPVGVVVDRHGGLVINDRNNTRLRYLGPVRVADEDLPAVSPGHPLALPLRAVGGTNTFTWMLDSPPPGLSLSSTTGADVDLIGTLNTPGTYAFGVTVTDSLAASYTADLTLVVRAPVMETLVGNGLPGTLGSLQDGLAATTNFPRHVAMDPRGRVVFADRVSHQVLRYDPYDRSVRPLVGTGVAADGPDLQHALATGLNGITGVAYDRDGYLFIGDTNNGDVRRVHPDGLVEVVASPGSPFGLDTMRDGSVIVADHSDHSIRQLDPRSGYASSTIAGGSGPGFGGDGGLATAAQFSSPHGVTVLDDQTVVVADTSNTRLRAFPIGGNINTLVTGFTSVFGVDEDASGTLWFVDQAGNVLLSFDGTTTRTVGGDGTPGYSGEGLDARISRVNAPYGLFVAPDGSVYFTDESGQRLRALR